MKWLIRTAAFAVLAFLGAWAYLAFSGPRMKDQPALQAQQAVLPPMSQAARPLREPFAPAPSTQQAQTLRSSLAVSPDDRRRGRVYYNYYCVFCHGDAGDGNGPVGQSYVPKPADLRSPKVGAYADGQVLRAMLTGVGHEPVLERVVPDEHRWPLVNYVRTLAVLPKK